MFKGLKIFLTVSVMVTSLAFQPNMDARFVTPRAVQPVVRFAQKFFAENGKHIANLIIAQGIMTAVQLVFAHKIAGAFGAGSRSRALQDRTPRYATADEGLIAPGTQAAQRVQGIINLINNPQRMGKTRAQLRKGILLTGPVGTGKTQLGSFIAKKTGALVVYESASAIIGTAQGSGARSIRELYDRAHQIPFKIRMKEKLRSIWARIRRRPYHPKPIVLVLDEADAFAGRRQFNAVAPADQVRAAEREAALEQLLTELDGAHQPGIFPEVFLVATTNAPVGTLDDGLLRPGRIREINIPVLNEADRLAVLQYHQARREFPLAPEVDLVDVAHVTDGWTGAELAHLLNNAALLVAEQDGEVIVPDALEAVREEMRQEREARELARAEREEQAAREEEMTPIERIAAQARLGIEEVRRRLGIGQVAGAVRGVDARVGR